MAYQEDAKGYFRRDPDGHKWRPLAFDDEGSLVVDNYELAAHRERARNTKVSNVEEFAEHALQPRQVAWRHKRAARETEKAG